MRTGDHDQRSILQIAWVVNDLEEAAHRWHRTMGVGPFLVNRHIALSDARYRGKPSSVDFSTAVAQAGPVQVELVQQHDDAPSCYRDSVPVGEEAMHHVAIMVADYEETVSRYQDQGFAIASSGVFGRTRFCYVDCRPSIGHMVEILEDSGAIRSFFSLIVNAARDWDGDPAGLLREL